MLYPVILGLAMLAQPPAVAAPKPDIAARVAAGKDPISGVDQCYFVQIPQLLLRRGSKILGTPARAIYSTPADLPGVSFTVRATDNSRGTAPKWQSIFPWPGFDVSTFWHEPPGTTQNVILLDGRPTSFKAKRSTGAESRLNPSFLLETPLDESPGSFIAAIESMDTNTMLTWQFLDGNGKVLASYNFDIRTLRNMPAALTGAEWACF